MSNNPWFDSNTKPPGMSQSEWEYRCCERDKARLYEQDDCPSNSYSDSSNVGPVQTFFSCFVVLIIGVTLIGSAISPTIPRAMFNTGLDVVFFFLELVADAESD